MSVNASLQSNESTLKWVCLVIFLALLVLDMFAYEIKKQELWNFNQKLFLTKIGEKQQAFWTAIFLDKFTLWHIKWTIYIRMLQANGLLFPEKPNKIHTDQSTLQVF